jgi:hypothetical protein
MKTAQFLSALSVAALGGLLILALPGSAQGTRINKNALEKTKFYEAPRELQIIDDRPVVRDFREAPQDAGSIEIPPGPAGSGGGYGGSGSGALGGGPGSSIPAGGLQLGGPNQGYRNAPAGIGSLPKSGFGGSNIPARGMGPRNLLPSGSSNNQLMGKMMTPPPSQPAVGRPQGMSPTPARTNGNYNGPAVSTYSGGYGQGSGSGYGGSASRTDSSVRGHLLKHN